MTERNLSYMNFVHFFSNFQKASSPLKGSESQGTPLLRREIPGFAVQSGLLKTVTITMTTDSEPAAPNF
ncbi:hypothetical protein ACU8KH_06161 [Lachancea thermotolerans]